jgi:lipid A 3-O-deacylase
VILSAFRTIFATACAAALALALSAAPARADDPSFLQVGLGYYDINDNEDAAEFRLEYRGQKMLWALKPVVGLMTTTDSAVYGYGGVAMDIFFGRRWVVTPSFVAGAYHDGNGKDLGHTVEFRSGLEISYRFDNRARVGAMVYHISNASIGDSNPGTEVLSFTYGIPLN